MRYTFAIILCAIAWGLFVGAGFFMSHIEDLSQRVTILEQEVFQLKENTESMQGVEYDIEKSISHLPLSPPVPGPVSAGFGKLRTRDHTGIDLASPWGTPIKVTATGVVTEVGYYPGYGNTVCVDHQNGLATVYAHLDRTNVYKGKEVVQGDILGTVGNTGNARGYHLHYEVLDNNVAINPRLLWRE